MAFTVSTEACTGSLNWTGVEASFVPGFPALDPSHLVVTYQPNVGVLVTLTAGVHYSAAIDGAGAVTVTPIAMPAAPGIVTIDRKTPAIQATNFINLGSFSPDIHTQLHDAAAMRSAEIRRDFARSYPALASVIAFTPGGNISSTNVQAALAELDAEKAAISSLASVAFSGAAPDLIGNITAWTPILSCAVPGDLAVTYSIRLGNIVQLNSRAFHVQYQIVTSAFNYTTAIGNLQIQGLPFTTAAGIVSRGALQFGGINKAGYTNLNTGTGGGATNLNVTASGMGVATANVAITDCPSGGTISLTGDHVVFV